MIKKLLFSLILITFSLSSIGTFQAAADELPQSLPIQAGSLLDDLNRNLKRQEELRKKISEAQSSQRNLASQINYMEGQIELTSLQIEETNTRLSSLTVQVQESTQKLEGATENYNHMIDVAENRIRKIYKEGFRTPLDDFLGSDDLNSVLIRQKYADSVRKSDVNLLSNLKTIKDNIETEKANLEKAKAETEDLKTRLVGQQNSLANQKAQKAYLLEVTKNSEVNYQRMLAQARLDQAALQAALGNSGTRLGPVKRGDIIAFQGNTGCSTGTHLHFAYLVGGASVDPMPYLRSGHLGWPQTNPIITQGFGANPQFYRYLGYSGGHPAIDMTAGFGSPILAARNGVAYAASDAGCPNLIPGTGPGKGVIIDHLDGTKTLYWHIK